MYLECSVYNCGGPIHVSMLRVNTRIETQGDRTGGEERLNIERLEAVWIQAYKWAWGLPRSTASDVFVLPAGMEYLRPVGIGEVSKGT